MLRSIAMVLGAALLGACSSLPNAGRDRPAAVVEPSSEAIQAAQLASHIQALQSVVEGSPAEQAEAMAMARAGYEQAQRGPAALRFGLLLAAPGHPSHDAELAQRVLREALSRRELLSAPERALGTIELQRVDAELRQAAENARLFAEAQQERNRQNIAPANTAALTRRVQTAEEENVRLKKQLDEALRRLEAIANIERGVDAPASNEGRKQ